jgi:hypothetical protein
MKKMLQSQIEQGLSYMIIGIIYKFQMIFLMGTEVIEWKPNVGCTEHTGDRPMDIQTWVKLNVGRTEHTGDRPMDIQT